MATQSAIHHMLAILAGDPASGLGGDTAVDSLARLIGRLGWGGLAPVGPSSGGASAPVPCFLRLTFPGIAPPDPFIVSLATAAGLHVESIAHGPMEASRWLLVGPQAGADISSAIARLRAVHRIHAVPFTTIEDR